MEENPYQSPRAEIGAVESERSINDFRATTIRGLGLGNLLVAVPVALLVVSIFFPLGFSPVWALLPMLGVGLHVAAGVGEARLLTWGVHLQVLLCVIKVILMTYVLDTSSVLVALPCLYVAVLNLVILRLVVSNRSRAVIGRRPYRGAVPPPLWYPLVVWTLLLLAEIAALGFLAGLSGR